jgi:hypothetical protein
MSVMESPVPVTAAAAAANVAVSGPPAPSSIWISSVSPGDRFHGPATVPVTEPADATVPTLGTSTVAWTDVFVGMTRSV